MELPEIARRVGAIDRTQIVYIEEYVLQYLQAYRCAGISYEERISLYGKHERREGVNIYIIYAAYPETDESEITEPSYDVHEKGQDNKQGKEQGKEQELMQIIGYLHRKQQETEVGREGFRGRLTGYYIFYDVNERMKDYLGRYYENQIKRQQPEIQTEKMDSLDSKFAGKFNAEGAESSQVNGREAQAVTEPAELIALSQGVTGHAPLLYGWLRIAALCIIIIFCTIAVTTINAYDEIEDFVQTIIQTSEWAKEQP